MDPVAGNILDPATLHKYLYARNNAVNAIDPSGRDDILECSVFAFEQAHNVVFAFDIAECNNEVLAAVAINL